MENCEAICSICSLQGSLSDIQIHFTQNHITETVDNDEDESFITEERTVAASSENVTMTYEVENDGIKWSREHTLLLIRLVEEHGDQFNQGLKKNVWISITKEMNKLTNKIFTYQQLDSKWKGLKKTYKKIKDHNNKSGNNRNKWEFFNVMDSFMAKKPEVIPVASCSSTSGLKINDKESNTNCEDESSSSSTAVQESSYYRKMKGVRNAAQKRHAEKLERYDKFLKILKTAVEHQTGQKIDFESD